MGIHYDYKSTRGNKAMEKQAKKDKKLAERKAKREAKEGKKISETETKLDVQKPITLEDLTNPDKKQMNNNQKIIKLQTEKETGVCEVSAAENFINLI